ncbi:MAG: TonB-dependent receptor [Candidatus Zixiibacteriota bacterium]|nr:MAG: TonB-dependent receptor [candidate division Zixibacteria bacterium]
MNLKLITLLCLAWLPAAVQAQATYPIRGFVVDSTSAEPLPGANVVLSGTDRGASTNLDGYFVIGGLEPGDYTLQISYLGYRTRTVHLPVRTEIMEPLHLGLIPQSMELGELVVTTEAEDEEQETRESPRVSTVPLTSQAFRALPSLGAEMDVLRILQTLPGVKSSSDLSSALYVRGGSPDQTLILMDHNVVYNPNHLFGLFSTFNADAVKRTELIKGGFPAQYGGRSGSVLEVITNEGNRKETEGMVSVGLISARGALEGPLPGRRGSYAVSGRRTYMEPILDFLRESLDTDLPDYYFYDANGKINFDLSPRTTLTLAGYLGRDDMDFEFGAEDDRWKALLSWGNRTFTARLRQVLSRDLYFSAGAAVSEYQSKWTFDDEGVIVDDGLDRLTDYSVKSDLEYLGHPRHRLQTGLWISRYDFRFRERNESLTWVDIDTFTYNYSLYLQDVWKLGALWEIQPGLRGYYHQAGDQVRFDPRLSILYRLDVDKRIKLAGGRYTQWINVLAMGESLTSNFDLWIPVDQSMKPPYSDQAVLGFEWDPRPDLQATFETYYTDMNGVVAFDPLVDSGTQAADPFVFGDGYAYGAEWMLRKTAGPISGWLGYSLSWTRRRYPETLYNEGNWFYPKWDRRHDFIAVANYAASRNWDLSATWRYNTGQGYTQAVGVYTLEFPGLDPGMWNDQGRYVVPGTTNNYRFPADHRLDLSATYKHQLFGLPAQFVLSIYNVYSRRSFWQRTFDTTENPVKVEDVKLLPILPLVSYEVRF